jgi:hypothetical protein
MQSLKPCINFYSRDDVKALAGITREQLEELIAQSDLSNADDRQFINAVVIDEVVETRYKQKWWDAKGCAPLNVSGEEYLRPVPRCVFGAHGWTVCMGAEWFCN